MIRKTVGLRGNGLFTYLVSQTGWRRATAYRSTMTLVTGRAQQRYNLPAWLVPGVRSRSPSFSRETHDPHTPGAARGVGL
jgi:hypothetical protein